MTPKTLQLFHDISKRSIIIFYYYVFIIIIAFHVIAREIKINDNQIFVLTQQKNFFCQRSPLLNSIRRQRVEECSVKKLKENSSLEQNRVQQQNKMNRAIFLPLLMTLIVAPSLSFVPQSQRGCLIPSVSQRARITGPQHVMSAINDDSSAATTELDTDEDTDADADSKMSSVFSESVQSEAREVLEKVGWAGVAPDLDNPEQPMTSDDPFVQNIDAGIRKDFGVGLDDLLNPAKVVNLERELYQLREELESTSDQTIIESIEKSIEKKEGKLAIERRSVFRDWLKTVFVGQAVVSFGVSYVMATNPAALFGGFDWYYYNSM